MFPTFRVSLFVTDEQKGILSGAHVIQAPVLRACMRITRHLGVSVHAVVSHRVACSDKKTPLPFSFSPWMAGFRNDADPPPDTKLLPQWRYCARVPYIYSECHRKHLKTLLELQACVFGQKNWAFDCSCFEESGLPSNPVVLAWAFTAA